MSTSPASHSPSPRRGDVSPISPPSPLASPSLDILSPRLDPIIEHVVADHTRAPAHHRAPSVTSITFKPRNRTSPPTADGIGQRKSKPPPRVRNASPPPPPFQHHVSFDNFAGGEATENNPVSFTLNTKHKGYQFKRRSRTFMVGIDENDYSDIALQWMLEELVDDGDEIICLRVVEKGAKITNDRNLERRQYQVQAKELLQRIQKKNDENRAISIVLEFAVGKVSQTFMKMIQMYEPAMLIVGTRGRSLGGVQGLVSNRNSFSKWCLQYSPIPVVVVRPTEKRIKKKNKRVANPGRQDYARILRESGIEEHETNAVMNSVGFETSNTPDLEAHAVAAALGLPASFDPTLKPIYLASDHSLKRTESGTSDVTSVSKDSASPDSRPVSPTAVLKVPKSPGLDSPAISGDESSEGEDDEEGEFMVMQVLAGNIDHPDIQKKLKLHDMELGEAAALLAPGGRKLSVGSIDSVASQGGSLAPDDDDDDDDDDESGE